MSCCHSLTRSARSLLRLLNPRPVEPELENHSASGSPSDCVAPKARQPSISRSSNDSFTAPEPQQPQASGVPDHSVSLKPRRSIILGSSNDNAAPELESPSISASCKGLVTLKDREPLFAQFSNFNVAPELRNPSILGSRQEYFTPEPHRFSACGPFDHVPSEIIHEIASWLPLSSAANLTLCNRKLKYILGNSYLLALRPDDSSKYERNLFLQGLDRHSPETFQCYGCSKLHFLAPTGEDRSTPEERFKWVSNFRCLNRNDSDTLLYTHVIEFHYHAQFRFEHMQVAMKLYRLGLVSDAKSYLKCLALTEPLHHEMTTSQPSNMGYYFFEPRIIHNRVFARAQSWISIPKEQDQLINRHTFLRYNVVCVHLDADFRGVSKRFYMILQCVLEQLRGEQESCGECRALIRCHYCPTEVLVETKRSFMQVERDLVVITKWQALGYGVSPFEPQWASHFQPRAPWPWPKGSTPGIIRDAFENQPGVKHDSIFNAETVWKSLKEEKSSSGR